MFQPALAFLERAAPRTDPLVLLGCQLPAAAGLKRTLCLSSRSAESATTDLSFSGFASRDDGCHDGGDAGDYGREDDGFGLGHCGALLKRKKVSTRISDEKKPTPGFRSDRA